MCPAQSMALCINGIDTNHSNRSAVPKRIPIISKITVYGIGIFLKKRFEVIPINKESIMNRSGDISIPLDESPAASKTVGENNNTVNKSFFIFTEY